MESAQYWMLAAHNKDNKGTEKVFTRCQEDAMNHVSGLFTNRSVRARIDKEIRKLFYDDGQQESGE